MEARLFEEDTVPAFTTPEFFRGHPWVDPVHQLGHAQRTAMVAGLIHETYATRPFTSLVDLGCGDGSLLAAVSNLPVPCWGYDAGQQNVERATASGLDVRQADFLRDPIEYGELIVASEVVEHLLDPHAFIEGLPGSLLVLSSPSAETPDWHYEHHSYCWDLTGYEDFVMSCGWRVLRHVECDAQVNHHGGVTRPQRFQAMLLARGA